ncbi:MAG TPA: PASTA domain-containing protein, partial [Thermoanaerobaculia bacterium]
PAGGIVKRGRRISVIVSLGAQGTSVPVLEGVTARQAEIMLEGSGLKLGRSARAYSDQVSKDLVIATDPPGETMVEQETAVDLLVSLRPVPRSFVLPDLDGRDAASAARSLRDEGFAVSLREGGSRQKNGLVSARIPRPVTASPPATRSCSTTIRERGAARGRPDFTVGQTRAPSNLSVDPVGRLRPSRRGNRARRTRGRGLSPRRRHGRAVRS